MPPLTAGGPLKGEKFVSTFDDMSSKSKLPLVKMLTSLSIARSPKVPSKATFTSEGENVRDEERDG